MRAWKFAFEIYWPLMLQVDFVLRGHSTWELFYVLSFSTTGSLKAKVGELTKLSFFSLYFDPDNFEVLIEGVSTGLKKTKTSKNKTQNLFTLSWKSNSMFGSSHSASSAYQKWPTEGLIKS